jgi:hypothetical protein
VREAGPAILLFKPGYHYAAYANGSSAEAPTHMTSRWNGAQLRSARETTGTDAMRADMQRLVTELLGWKVHDQAAGAAQFVCAVSTRHEELEREGRGVGIPSREEIANYYGVNCDRQRGRP